MRAELGTIQQTLTPEAAAVLNHAIADAGRRGHGQTTPLHVAAILLAAPSGFLRQACIRSHPNSSHPLQCRALELCFSVALDRLPTVQAASGSSAAAAAAEPPLSNALMAALKRAQAQQRRGCPEQQQQPLLAVKVELLQLIISILDDPSVSRVMREASFSSPAVKATVEAQSLSLNSTAPAAANVRGLYMNPRLSQSGPEKREDVKRVMDVMTRSRARNPVLVGNSSPDGVLSEVLRTIERRESRDGATSLPRSVEVIAVEPRLGRDASSMVKELQESIEARIGRFGDGGIFLNLGDLKWLIEHPAAAAEAGRAAVLEMGKLMGRFSEGGRSRIWLIGAAACETYIRCKRQHPSLETDWDLQAVPVTARAPPFPRLGTNGILSNSLENLKPLKILPSAPTTVLSMRMPEKMSPAWSSSFSAQCINRHEQELELSQKTAKPPPLPLWLKNAKALTVNHETSDQKDQESQTDACLDRFRDPNSERIKPLMTGSCNSRLLGLVQPELKLATVTGEAFQLNPNPASEVETDLVLGTKSGDGDRVKDFRGRIIPREGDSFKRLLKGLTEQVWWQHAAASAVAMAVAQCKSGDGKTRCGQPKNDVWLLFTGPDRVGKRKMASALSELVCCTARIDPPVIISLSPSSRNDEPSSRGKTTLDRIAEAIRRNPYAVIMMEDVDEGDAIICGSIKRAMESGRLIDSHGREIGLGCVTFILASEPPSPKVGAGSGHRELRLRACAKRRANWDVEDGRRIRPKTETPASLAFDLNLSADSEADGNGSHNSSDLTIEHEPMRPSSPPPSTVSPQFRPLVDGAVVFSPVDLAPIRRDIESSIASKFVGVFGDSTLAIHVEAAALKRITEGVWFGRVGFEEWAGKALVPSFHWLKEQVPSDAMDVRLESDEHSGCCRSYGDPLPEKIQVVVEERGLGV